MRLRQIKLAGFKSFVDPTQIDVPGRLVGVVGPNGCGKSNVIDAVRWVLGESKAAELRGESMQDVIFNGSSQRKAGGRASVELVFDNIAEAPEQRALSGPWASYAEISVKRVLTRDGTSSYSINNQAVRRRDVQDMFLGTGLGPRAYAIIGQGMITRIIEARPEELRIFLEEAAGVSKYKERRREAENRLADTRDNLTRVEDIVRELASQIDKLEQQAEVAQRYRTLQSEHDQQQQLLWLTRKREAGAEQGKVAHEVASRAAAFESHVADLRAVELTLEQTRTAHYAQSDAVHAAQGDLLNVNAEVSKLESELRMLVDARARLQTQIESLHGTRERRRAEQQDLAQRAADLERLLVDGAVRLASARAAVLEQEQVLPAREHDYAQAREALTAARSLAFAAEQAIEAAGAEQRALERQRAALAQRRERLQDESRELGEPDEARLAQLRTEAERLVAELAGATERVALAQASEQQAQAERQQHADARARDAEALTRLEARHHAAQELQAKIEADDRLDPWLKTHGLDTLPRLFQRLHVEAGWEAAFEAVLRERVEALEVNRLDSLAGLAASAPPARVAFYSTQSAVGVAGGSLAQFAPLASYLRGHDAALVAVVADWLAHVYVAPDLQAALAARASLPAGGQFVVQAGHLVGRHVVRYFAADDRKSGLLARRQEIENLEREVRAQRLIVEQAAASFARAEAQARQAAESVITRRQMAEALRARMHALQIDVVRLNELTERVKHRAGQIDAELAEMSTQEHELIAGRSDAEARFEQFDAELAAKQEAVEAARVGYEDADRVLRAARELHQQRAADASRIEFELAAARERQQDIAHAVQVAAEDAERLAADIARAQEELTRLDDSAVRSGLDQWLAQRLGCEDALRSARSRLDEIAGELRRTDERRLTLEREQQPLRDRITELQLKEQAARLSLEQFAEQLAQAGADETALGARLDAMAGALRTRANTIQTELARLAEAVTGLGAVNLAALDELATARERKGFLDAQSADLTAAMTTLEDAIRKIDLETRELLQQTFTQVNQHFGALFPKLFGGGEARLVMTGEEILDAGVQVMAQPPGKRNSTIHLLSGGEKALTATALVFALFKLNPAPFCLLDEVDAPLDDSNTERFCALVRSMIGSTQFLFITHNKIAMEMAEQLIGVTMQEQGVSRIVAVDIDAAVRLTAEAA